MPKPRVLIVEDEALVRTLMVETLTDAGYEVEEAPDSDRAAAMLLADGYELLVTDVHMPGAIDGIELAKLANARYPDLAVVIVTGRPDVLRRLRGTGIRGVALPKPFRLEELLMIVGRYSKAG